SIDLGGQGPGFNPVSMMAGMAVGSAVGKNIAGVMDQSINQKETNQSTPPSIPVTKYYLAEDDNPTGPFTIDELRSMIPNGEFKVESLVWKEGMAKWEKAVTQTDLKGLFPPKI